MRGLRLLGMLASFVADEIARQKGKPYDTGEEYTRIVIMVTPLKTLKSLSPETVMKIYNSVTAQILLKGLNNDPLIRDLWVETSDALAREINEIRKLSPVEIAFQFAQGVPKEREKAIEKIKGVLMAEVSS